MIVYVNKIINLGEYEMTTLKHQYEALVPGKSLDIPESIKVDF